VTAAATVVLRPAAASDIAEISEIYAHHVRSGLGTFEEEPPPPAEMERRRAEVAARNLPYLVAEEAGRIRGYAYATLYRLRSAYRFTLEDSIYVAPDSLRRGIGRMLLEALVERSAAAGYRQMVAVIGGSDNWSSIKLHESAGFARIGLQPAVGFKHGRWVDSVLMQRALGGGATTLPSASPA